MNRLWVVVLLFCAASSFARDEGVKCEAESRKEKDDSLIVVCPPPFAFSPIRLKLVLEQIDNFGWQDVDLKQPTPVQVRSANTPEGERIFVRLPIQKGARRWLAWRKFTRITRFAFSDDLSAAEYQPKHK